MDTSFTFSSVEEVTDDKIDDAENNKGLDQCFWWKSECCDAFNIRNPV